MQEAPPHPLGRAFIRCADYACALTTGKTGRTTQETAHVVVQAAHQQLQQCFAALRLLHSTGAGAIDWAQICVNVLAATPPASATSNAAFGNALRLAAAAMLETCAAQLRQLAVAEWCLRLCCTPAPDGVQAWRIVVSLPTGALLPCALIIPSPRQDSKQDCWMEFACPNDGLPSGDGHHLHAGHEYGLSSVHVFCERPAGPAGEIMLHAVDPTSSIDPPNSISSVASPSSWTHGAPVLERFAPLQPLQQRRLRARRHATTYCYDFPALVEDAVRAAWQAQPAGTIAEAAGSKPYLVARELVLKDSPDFRKADAQLLEVRHGSHQALTMLCG
jgi:hypothetical protein